MNDRKHWPDKDVEAVGSWRDAATVMSVYQQADMKTMFKVVSEPAELREA